MQNRNNFGILLVSSAIALSAIGVAFFTQSLSDGQHDSSGGVVATDSSHTLPARDTSFIDEDEDGLLGWEEALYGTNPLVADTDADGILDGEEVALGSDPAVEGAGATDSYVAPSALSSTDALARELFTSYAAARQGGSLDTATLNTALEEIVDRRTAVEKTYTPYTLADVQTQSSVSVHTYARSLNSALAEANTIREYELNVFARAVDNNGGAELQKLKATATIYRSIQQKLLTTNVPDDLVHQHLAFINSLGLLAYEIEQLSNWNGDPLDALVLVGTYSTAEDEMANAFDSLIALMEVLRSQS